MNKHFENIVERHDPCQKRKREQFRVMNYPAWTIAAHGWLECVIHFLALFQFAENNVIRLKFRHN